MMKNYEDALKRCELDFEDRIENGNILMTGRMDIEILQETLKEYKILKEKAIPKKVTVIDEPDLFYIYYCPNCGATLMVNRNGHPKHLFNYCGSCGQALKWSE